MIGYRLGYNKITASREEACEKKYLDIIKYKSMHENCDVPKGRIYFWKWVKRPRTHFTFVWSRGSEKYIDDIEWLILTANRVEWFNILGFKWKLPSSNDTTITTAKYKVLYNKTCITQNSDGRIVIQFFLNISWSMYTVMYHRRVLLGHG